MRIAYIHNAPMPAVEASTVNVSKMCDAFAVNGHEALLIHATPRAANSLPFDRYYGLKRPIDAMALPLLPGFGFGRLFSLSAALLARARRADLVYSRKPDLLLPAIRAGLSGILELHTPIMPAQRRSRAAFAALLRHRRLLRIVVISHALRDDLVAEFPEAAQLLIVAHDGADPVAEHAAARHGDVSARPRVGYAGHLYPGKGMEMIAALAELRPNIDFLVLGGRAVDVARWRSNTTHLANLTLAGMVAHSEVPRRLAGCDVVLAPYAKTVQVSDGTTDVARWMSPLKIFEYMAQGLAIMASDLPVLREILRDGETAILCPADQPDAWATALDTLLAHPERIRTIGAAARAKLEACYTWQRRAAAILDGIEPRLRQRV